MRIDSITVSTTVALVARPLALTPMFVPSPMCDCSTRTRAPPSPSTDQPRRPSLRARIARIALRTTVTLVPAPVANTPYPTPPVIALSSSVTDAPALAAITPSSLAPRTLTLRKSTDAPGPAVNVGALASPSIVTRYAQTPRIFTA